MTAPEIDVLLPVRRAAASVPAALQDVLDQRGVRVRVLAVVDVDADGRDDGSRRWLEQRARGEPRLAVWRGAGRGPAAALQLGLERASALWVGHMEADDRCPPDRFARLWEALQARPELEGLTSRVEQLGDATPGMARYLAWQNDLLTGDAMARDRFVEIPALHQTGLYRRAALERVGGYRTRGPWPVDIDFWFRWFEAGLPVAKLAAPLYRWRQHPGQSTRGGGSHAQETLRAAKLDALVRLLGAGGAAPAVRLLSTGRTFEIWRAALPAAGIEVADARRWRPGQPPPLGPDPAAPRLLAAYGMPAARDQVRRALGHPSEPDELLFTA